MAASKSLCKGIYNIWYLANILSPDDPQIFYLQSSPTQASVSPYVQYENHFGGTKNKGLSDFPQGTLYNGPSAPIPLAR